MISNDLQISESAIRAHNLCIRKAYMLIFSSGLSSPNAYEKMQSTLKNITRQNYFHSISNHLIAESFSTLALSEGVDVLTNVNLSDGSFFIKNGMLIKAPGILHQDKPRYEPIIFSSFNKIQPEDKAELSFIGHILSKYLGYLPDNGHVVFVDGRTIAIKLSVNLQKYLPIIDSLQGWLTQNSDIPPVLLNKHCPYCEFQNICKETAIQEDSLSLLGGMNKKQILKFEKKVFSQSSNFRIFIALAKGGDVHVRNVLPTNMSFKRSH